MSFAITKIFLESVVIGLFFAIPIGPVGLLCVRRTLQTGFLIGVLTGLGAAFADTFYAGVAAFGLEAIADLLKGLETPIRLIGGIIILIVAWKTFTSRSYEVSDKSPVHVFIPTFILALTNPATIIAFTVVFSDLGFAGNRTMLESLSIVAGVFIGSMLWWTILSGFVSFSRSQAILNNMTLINRFAGLMLLGFGLWAISSVL